MQVVPRLRLAGTIIFEVLQAILVLPCWPYHRRSVQTLGIICRCYYCQDCALAIMTNLVAGSVMVIHINASQVVLLHLSAHACLIGLPVPGFDTAVVSSGGLCLFWEAIFELFALKPAFRSESFD